MPVLGAAVAALFGGLALFQIALALGAPWGRLAWGGAHDGVLPARLRAASVAALVPVIAGLAAALRAGGWVAWPGAGAATALLYALAALFAVSFVGNALSPSPAERRMGVPLTLALCAGCLALAIGA